MEAEYFSYAWKLYVLGVGCILLSQLFLLWVLPKRLTFFIMLLSAVILLMPYNVIADYPWKAPAFVVLLIDFFIQKGEDWPRALNLLLKSTAITGLIGLIAIFVLPSKRKQKSYDHNDDGEDHDEDYDDEDSFIEKGIRAK